MDSFSESLKKLVATNKGFTVHTKPLYNVFKMVLLFIFEGT